MKNVKLNKSFQSAQFTHEIDSWENDYLVIGSDEAGRGSLFGPVVAAAVILKPFAKNRELKDSKLLSQQQRERLYLWLKENSHFSTQIINHRDIDKHNIYKASRIAMQNAIINLVHQVGAPPRLILTDAMPLKFDNSFLSSVPVIHAPKGEYWSATIAAASIIAKVTRDILLEKFALINPCYNLAKNKGYGTSEHRVLILKHGKSFLHRKTFNLKEENHG